MAECFEYQERTLDKRIVVRQVEIVPEQRPLQGGNVHTGAKQNQEETPQPLALAVGNQASPRKFGAFGRRSSWDVPCLRHIALGFISKEKKRAPFRERKDALHIRNRRAVLRVVGRPERGV